MVERDDPGDLGERALGVVRAGDLDAHLAVRAVLGERERERTMVVVAHGGDAQRLAGTGSGQ